MQNKQVQSPYATEALRLIGGLIRLGRKSRSWTEQELSERLGVSRLTLQRVERGAPSCAVGTVFEAATLVGVPLFAENGRQLARERSLVEERLILMPERIRPKTLELKDDF